MKQIIIIHWWTCFANEENFLEALKTRDYDPFEERKWRKDRLINETKNEYQAIKPEMPNKNFASYKAWKIWFEKIFPYLNKEELIIVAHSLWGIFISKYLTENKFPKKTKQLHLIAPVYDENDLPDDDNYIWSFLFDTDKLPNIQEQIDQIFLYHSTDDEVVPYSHIEKYKAHLPNAKLTTFTEIGHINQETFPELLKNIQ